MVLGKLLAPGRPTTMDNSRARAYSAYSRCGWGLFGHFSLVYHFSFLSPSLWETARYRLKYCLKGPLSPKQSTNQRSAAAFGSGDLKMLTMNIQRRINFFYAKPFFSVFFFFFVLFCFVSLCCLLSLSLSLSYSTLTHCISRQWRECISCVGTVNQGPVVQSIVSLTSSLRGQLVKCFTAL